MRWLASLVIGAALALWAGAANAAGGAWALNSYPSATVSASITQGVSGNMATTGLVNRLRALTVSVAASGSVQAPLKVVVRDGASATGSIIWSATLAAAANSVASIVLNNLDLRSSIGSSLTVEFTAGGSTNVQQAVSASGDLVPVGYPYGGP